MGVWRREFISQVREINRVIPWVIWFALGFFALIFLLQTAIESTLLDGWPAALIVVAVPFVGWLPAVLVHELGHAIAAYLVGWRVWVFGVGPFVLRLRPGWTLSVRWPLAGDAGGFVLPVPKTRAAYTRLRDVIVTAGGPAASIVAAVAAHQVAQSFTADSGIDRLVYGILLAFSASSVGCAVVTTWPYTNAKGVGNDAAKILIILRVRRILPNAAARFGEILTSFDFAPTHWDGWVADTDAALREIHTTTSLLFIEAVAIEDYALAHSVLGDAADDSTEVLRAYLEVTVNHDAASAEAKLASVAMPRDWQIGYRVRDLILAHILSAAGELDSARWRLDRLAQAVANDPSPQPHWDTLIARARSTLEPPQTLIAQTSYGPDAL